MAPATLLRCTCAGPSRPTLVAAVSLSIARPALDRRQLATASTRTDFAPRPLPDEKDRVRRSPPSLPYVLHAHVRNNNSIFTLSIAPRNHRLAPPIFGSGLDDKRVAFYNQYPNGRTVARATSGSVKAADGKGSNPFRNAARSSYEAQTQAVLALFDRFDEVVDCAINNRALTKPAPRPGRHAEKDRAWLARRKPFVPFLPESMEIVFSGFGQGREALVAALSSPRGEAISSGNFGGIERGRGIKLVSDATPIKRGGDRPRKQRRV